LKECAIDKNKQNSTCPYEPRSRKGLCCECIRYHRKMKQVPGCCFPEEIETIYDRSIERFIRVYQEREPWW